MMAGQLKDLEIFLCQCDCRKLDFIWSYRAYEDCKIPFWAEIKRIDWWCETKLVGRVACYFLCMMDSVKHISNNNLIIVA